MLCFEPDPTKAKVLYDAKVKFGTRSRLQPICVAFATLCKQKYRGSFIFYIAQQNKKYDKP